MLIDFRGLKAKHGMRVTGVLHVGAHECEEAGVYAEIVEPGARVVWVEGNPSICARMRARGVADVHEALVSDVDGAETDFIVTNNGQSSSILELAEHSREHPDVFEVARVRLKTVTLASLLAGFEEPPVFNFINLDIQGAELLALRGLGAERLSSVDYVYTEVNVRELYAGCALLPEMDAFLGAAGFERADTAITRHGWGDALYLRKSRKLPIVAGRYINLDSRPDRDAAMRDLAARLPFPVTRLSATARDNGALGCALSHVAALDELSAIPGRPDDWCVVLEDDFRLTRNGESALVPALSAALVPDNNAVLLSYRLLSPKSSVCLSPGTVELRGVYTASGYAVRRGFMPALRRCFHEAAAGLASGRPTPIDVAWFALQVPGGGFVGPCPKLGEQTPSYSDIERRHVDYGAIEHEVPPRSGGRRRLFRQPPGRPGQPAVPGGAWPRLRRSLRVRRDPVHGLPRDRGAPVARLLRAPRARGQATFRPGGGVRARPQDLRAKRVPGNIYVMIKIHTCNKNIPRSNYTTRNKHAN